jgi:type II secretory pathway pseudopilin PulG
MALRVLFRLAVVFHRNNSTPAGLTLVESVVAITLLGIGLTSTITALTKFNAFASSSRNLTGAYTTVMTQIDAIESASPFDPLHVSETGAADPLIPAVLTLDTDRQLPLPIGPLVEDVRVYLYKDPNDPSKDIVVVNGKRKTSVVDVSQTYGGVSLPMRRATVSVDYTYLGRNYSYSMSTLRSSDG